MSEEKIVEKARDLRRAGLEYAEIAEELGITFSQAWATCEGLRINRVSHRLIYLDDISDRKFTDAANIRAIRRNVAKAMENEQ